MFWTLRACVRTSEDVHVILLEPAYAQAYASRVLTPQTTPSIYLMGRRTVIGSYDQRRIEGKALEAMKDDRESRIVVPLRSAHFSAS